MCADGLENSGCTFDGWVEEVPDRILDVEVVWRRRVDDVVECFVGLEYLRASWVSFPGFWLG